MSKRNTIKYQVKIDDRKKLHKVKKHWVVMAMSVFGVTGGGFLLSQQSPTVHADTVSSSAVQSSVADVYTSQATQPTQSDTSTASLSTMPQSSVPSSVSENSTYSDNQTSISTNTSVQSVYATSNVSSSLSNNITSVTTSQGENTNNYSTNDTISDNSNVNYTSTNNVSNTVSSVQSSNLQSVYSGANQSVNPSVVQSSQVSIQSDTNDSTAVSNVYAQSQPLSSQVGNMPSTSVSAQLDNRDGDTPVFTSNGIEKYADGHVVITPVNVANQFSVYGDAVKLSSGVQLLTDQQPSTQESGAHGDIGVAAYNSALNLSKSFTFTANVSYGGDGLGMVFYPSVQGAGKYGLAGASLGIVGLPNAYGFKIDTFQSTDDNGAPGFPYGTFVDTDSNGHEILNSGYSASNGNDFAITSSMYNTFLDPNNSNNFANGSMHTAAVAPGSLHVDTPTVSSWAGSGTITFSYTPDAQVSGDTQTGTLSVTFPNKSNGTNKIYHTISYSADSPSYYFSILGNNDWARANQSVEFQPETYTPTQQATISYVDADNNSSQLSSQTLNGHLGDALDTSSIQSVINSYTAQGYVLSNNQLNSYANSAATSVNSDGTPASFSNIGLDGATAYSDGQVHYSTDLSTLNPVYTISFTHGTNFTAQSSAATRTIYFKNTDNQDISAALAQSVMFVRSVATDAVTGSAEDNKDTPWQVSGASQWSAVSAPDFSSLKYSAATTPLASAVSVSDPTSSAAFTFVYPDAQSTAAQSKSITRTLNFQDTRGNNIIPSDSSEASQTVSFSRYQVYDARTNAFLGYQHGTTVNNDDSWSPSGQTIGAYHAPDLSALGYATPQQSMASSAYVTPNDSNVSYTFVYPDGLSTLTQQKNVNRLIHYVDAESGTDIATPVSQSIPFKRTAVVDDVLKSIIGYNNDGSTNVLMDATHGDLAWTPTAQSFNAVQSPDLSSLGYQPADNVDSQVITPTDNDSVKVIKYNHNIAFVQPDNNYQVGSKILPQGDATWPDDVKSSNLIQNITRTLNYVDASTGQSISSPTVQTVTYTRMPVIDQVTGKLLGWSLNNSRKIDVAADDGDNAWETNDDQWKKTITPDLSAQGYVSPSINEFPAQSIRVGDKNTILTVSYGHQLSVVNASDSTYPDGLTKADLQHDITRTISYVDKTSKQSVTPDVIETVSYFRTPVIDNVTHKVIGYSLDQSASPQLSLSQGNQAWYSNDDKWEGIDSPILNGYYKPQDYRVYDMAVAADQQNAHVIVEYVKQPVKSAIKSVATTNSSSANSSSSSSAISLASNSITPSSSQSSVNSSSANSSIASSSASSSVSSSSKSVTSSHATSEFPYQSVNPAVFSAYQSSNTTSSSVSASVAASSATSSADSNINLASSNSSQLSQTSSVNTDDTTDNSNDSQSTIASNSQDNTAISSSDINASNSSNDSTNASNYSNYSETSQAIPLQLGQHLSPAKFANVYNANTNESSGSDNSQNVNNNQQSTLPQTGEANQNMTEVMGIILLLLGQLGLAGIALKSKKD